MTTTQVIVLNGGSSAGVSTLARSLQGLLPDPWLVLGVDSLIEAMPSSLGSCADGLVFGPHGEVSVGRKFRVLGMAWNRGIATMVDRGARVTLDEVFLEGAASQERLRVVFSGLAVLWVGVRCERAVAVARESIEVTALSEWPQARPRSSTKA